MPTFQDMHRARQHETFVGREVESLEFRESLLAPIDDPGRSAIFFVGGQSGMGKSTFVRHCREIAAAAGASSGSTDESDEDLLQVMESLARSLDPRAFVEFHERAERYRQLRQELGSRSDAPDETNRVIAANLGEIGTKLARRIPVAGLAFDFVDDEKFGVQIAEVVDFVVRNCKKRDHADLLLDPLSALTPLFVKGIAKVLADCSVVLCFDTFEETQSYVEPWLLDLLNGKFGDFPRNLTLVIAGQGGLDPVRWGEFDTLTNKIDLKPLSQSQVVSYLSSKGITAEDQVSGIVAQAHGIPLFLAIFAMGGQEGVANESVVDRVLRFAPKSFRELALVGAIPRLLNRDVGAQLFGESKRDAVFNWLIQTPFVRPVSDGWRYHDLIRAQFLAYLRRSSPSAFREVHGKLSKYYDQQESLLADSGDYVAARAAALESTYHLLFVQQREGLQKVAGAALAGWTVSPAASRAWGQVMRSAGRDQGRDSLEQWGSAWLEAVEGMAHSDDGPAISLFGQVLAETDLSSDHSDALMCRSQLYRGQRRFDLALLDLDRAEEIDPDPVYFGYQRSLIYLKLGNPESAFISCEQAIEGSDVGDDKRLGLLLLLRVQILWELFSASIALDAVEELGSTESQGKYFVRGELLRDTGDPASAIRDFQMAMKIDPSRKHPAWKEIASVHLEQGDIEQAMEAVKESLLAAPACGHCWEMLAQIYSKTVSEEEVKTKLFDAIQLSDVEKVRPYRALGIMAHGSVKDACQELETAVAEDPTNPETRLWLADALKRAHREGEALQQVDECLRRRPGWPAAIRERALLRFRSGDFTGSEEDWDTLGSSLTGELPTRELAARGHGLSILGQYAEAIEVLDTALAKQLVPEVAYNRLVARCRLDERAPSIDERHLVEGALEESPHALVKVYGQAGILTLAGEEPKALEALSEAYEIDPSTVAEWASTDPAWEGMRGAKEFDGIVNRRIGRQATGDG